MASGFLCICPAKEVELGGDGALHRAEHEARLHAELEFTHEAIVRDQYAYRQGGGVRVINASSSMTLAETESVMAVCKGTLDNRQQLAVALGLAVHAPAADVLIALYAKLGVDMLGHLAGSFAFCLYDAKQARVLAARDPSGLVPLVQGRTAKRSLLIACGTYMPPGADQVEDIAAGEYKYGWHAAPRRYVVGVPKQPNPRQSLDAGRGRRTPTSPSSSRRHSLDSYSPGTSPKPGLYTPPSRRGSMNGEGFHCRLPTIPSAADLAAVAAAVEMSAGPGGCDDETASSVSSESMRSAASSETSMRRGRRLSNSGGGRGRASRGGRQRAQSEDGAAAAAVARAAAAAACAPARSKQSQQAAAAARPRFTLHADAPEFKPSASCTVAAAPTAAATGDLAVPAVPGTGLAC